MFFSWNWLANFKIRSEKWNPPNYGGPTESEVRKSFSSFWKSCDLWTLPIDWSIDFCPKSMQSNFGKIIWFTAVCLHLWCEQKERQTKIRPDKVTSTKNCFSLFNRIVARCARPWKFQIGRGGRLSDKFFGNKNSPSPTLVLRSYPVWSKSALPG